MYNIVIWPLDVPARNRLGKHEAVIVDRHRLNLIHRQSLPKFFVFRWSNKLPMESADAPIPTFRPLERLMEMLIRFSFNLRVTSLGPPIGGTYVGVRRCCLWCSQRNLWSTEREGAGENEKGNGKRRKSVRRDWHVPD